jgi:bifunctional non-homologous end joining protein LigD
VHWEEVEQGVRIEDFRIDNVPQRLAEVGDLWKGMLGGRGRFKLDAFV